MKTYIVFERNIKMKLEDILTDKSTSFDGKIPTLVTVWLRLKELLPNSQSKCLDRVIEWSQSHTLNLVLHGEWTAQSDELKNRLYKVVEDFDNALVNYENLTSRRCKKLIEVVRDPWGDSTLCKILNEPDKCTKEEELTYFSTEHGFLAAMRLKKLCDSHCEDLALRFANACLRCLRMPESQNFLVVTTEDQKRYILDIYIALLHKYKRTHDIINELKHLSLEEGLQLVQRFTNKKVEICRVWKHCSRIAELAAQFFMTAAMTKPVSEIKPIMTDLINAWVVLNDKLEGIDAIPTIIRRIVQTADSAAHIYICCDVLNEKYGDKIKFFIIELYIRALTTDMNEMEKQKTSLEVDKLEETSKRLAEGFLSLADLLQNHLGVSRECVLTSFSLNPTRSCMERLEKLAIACGKVSLPTDNSLPLLHNSKCNNLDALILIKGDAVTGSKNYDVLSAPNQILDAETLGLSEQLCDDLAVVLSSPRYQMLSWVLDWNELKSTCDRYLSNAEGARNTVKELKYLNIDYNQFKDWPCDEERQQYGGIEKGYEENNNSVVNGQSNDSNTGRGRRRRKNNRIFNLKSEYEATEKKDDSHAPDTATKNAVGLCSDDLQHMSKKSKFNNNFAVISNQQNQADLVTNCSSEEIMSIFATLGNSENPVEISKPSYGNPNLQPFILPEKRSSDPQVLKNLRMYRTKKVQDLNNAASLKDDLKLVKLEDMPHMNPRVLLDRHDFNNKHSIKALVKQDIDNFGNKRDLESSKNKPLNNNNIFTEINMNPCVLLDRYELQF